ncbi:hypothetical protein BYT27DRAFT_7249606 [Phlegmacium glaucopus]|nr:hypothetical protein BYT27DRAFT_7249606 [Phlegmacium glaucopus]
MAGKRHIASIMSLYFLQKVSLSVPSSMLQAAGMMHMSHALYSNNSALMYQMDTFLLQIQHFLVGQHQSKARYVPQSREGERILAEYAAQQLTLAVNRQLLSYRQTAKWGIRMIQGSFGHLRVPLKISSPKRRQRLLEIIIRLANAAEDEQLWLDLGDMMFGDIWRRDCVSRFHLVVEDQ